LLRKGAILA